MNIDAAQSERKRMLFDCSSFPFGERDGEMAGPSKDTPPLSWKLNWAFKIKDPLSATGTNQSINFITVIDQFRNKTSSETTDKNQNKTK